MTLIDHDPTEAPPGYVAVKKSSLSDIERSQNICRSCDYRPECQRTGGPREYRCSTQGAIDPITGKIYQRKDGHSVVFKKRKDE